MIQLPPGIGQAPSFPPIFIGGGISLQPGIGLFPGGGPQPQNAPGLSRFTPVASQDDAAAQRMLAMYSFELNVEVRGQMQFYA